MDNLSEKIGKIKGTDAELENLLANHVVQELNNEHGFMKMRACSVVLKFTRDSFNIDLLKKISDGVCACLNDKANLPVRTLAAQALERLLKQEQLK